MPQSFELQLLLMSPAGEPSVVIANIYKPPKSSKLQFLDELSDLLTLCGNFIGKDKFILCGDFNCPSDDSQTEIDSALQSVFDIHGLTQHVRTPTRVTPTVSNILDLIVTSSSHPSCISRVNVSDSKGISDHDLVTCHIATNIKPSRRVINYEFRSLKSLNYSQFIQRLLQSPLFTAPATSADEYANQIVNETVNVLDRICPIQRKAKFAPTRLTNRWLSPDACKAKRRRRLERK